MLWSVLLKKQVDCQIYCSFRASNFVIIGETYMLHKFSTNTDYREEKQFHKILVLILFSIFTEFTFRCQTKTPCQFSYFFLSGIKKSLGMDLNTTMGGMDQIRSMGRNK
jgi:hypothetical protein